MSDKPIVITDQDVLTVIAEDDEIASATDAAFASLSSVPPATLAAWKTDLLGYQGWASLAKQRLQGGFFGGEWFGVPDDYNAALAWGATLKRHASDAQNLGAVLPTLPTVPDPSTPVSASGLSLGDGSKVLIGLGLVAVILLVVKR